MGNSSSSHRSLAAALAVCLFVGIGAAALWKAPRPAPPQGVEPVRPAQQASAAETPAPRLADTSEPPGPPAKRTPNTANEARETVLTPADESNDPARAPTFGLHLEVVDSSGAPIERAKVIVGEGEWTTDSSGACEVTTPSPGHFQLDVEGPDPELHRFMGAELSFDVSSDEPWAEATVTLMQPARIVGTFSCTDGSAPREAAVDVCSLASRSWTSAIADEEGAFTTEWIAPGPIVLYARNGSWSDTDLKERDTFELIEGEVYVYHGSLAPAIDLTGTLVDGAGRPLKDVEVDVVDGLNADYSESVYSKEDGLFRVEGLYPGEYLIVLPSADPQQANGSGTTVNLPKGRARLDAGNVVFR